VASLEDVVCSALFVVSSGFAGPLPYMVELAPYVDLGPPGP